MRYMLLIYNDEAAVANTPIEKTQQILAAYGAYTEALKKSGAWLAGDRLRSTQAATSVRMADGKTNVLDGPYADTKEQLAGFYMIEATDIDAAIEWGARCPAAGTGTVEVRPIWEMTEYLSEDDRVMDSRPETARAAAEAAARQSYGKLVAYLAARTRDVAGAEDALADAFAAALERWPRTGVPEKPEAWLLAVARRRRVDAVRRRLTSEAGRDHLKLIAEEIEASMVDEDLPDDRLRLMFACAHPAIEARIRAPLILQTILGFDAATIASAFLVSPATMGQRLVRAKARIRETGIPFRVPERDELGERLDAVLEAIYAAFAEGWADPAGTETRRRNLATEGIWLGRLAASLMPHEPEALGLLALMLFAEARRPARRDADGDYVPLAEQDTTLWDGALIEEAETLLRRAAAELIIGRYQLEAAVQSAHATRRLTRRTDWAAIKELYDALSVISGSPVVAINRAVAIAESGDAAAGLAVLDALSDDRRLAEYQPYWAARAGLLARLGQTTQAAEAYDRATGLERDPAVRRFLQGKRAALGI